MNSIETIQSYKEETINKYKFYYYKFNNNSFSREFHFQYPLLDQVNHINLSIDVNYYILRYLFYLKKIKLVLYTTKNYIPWASLYCDEVVVISEKDFTTSKKLFNFINNKGFSKIINTNIIISDLVHNMISFLDKKEVFFQFKNYNRMLNYYINKPIIYDKDIVNKFFDNYDKLKEMLEDKIYMLYIIRDVNEKIEENNFDFKNIINFPKNLEKDKFGYLSKNEILKNITENVWLDGILSCLSLGSVFFNLTFNSYYSHNNILPFLYNCNFTKMKEKKCQLRDLFLKKYNKAIYYNNLEISN